MEGLTPKPAAPAVAASVRRRRQEGFHAIAAVALAGLLAAMAHYLALRHHARADWSATRFYALSDKTLGLLRTLEEEVRVTVLLRGGDRLLPDVDNLLREYEAACPRIRYARIDPDRDLARLDALRQRVPDAELADGILVERGGKRAVLRRTDLADFDPAHPEDPAPLDFKGEQALTSAILAVTRGRPAVVYALAGHGEKTPADHDPATGLSEFARLLRRENIELRLLSFAGRRGVPEDADALLIVGPVRRFAQPELDFLQAYLDRNGRALILLDAQADTGLEAWLSRWNVRAGFDLAFDPGQTLGGFSLVAATFARHPLTEKLHLALALFRARTVEPLDAAREGPTDRPQATRLVATSPDGWAETDFEAPPQFEASRGDRRGPVTVAVAVERGPLPGLDMQIRPTRLVVVGDAGLAGNSALPVYGNRDFLLNAVNWLLDRRELMAIAPRSLDERQRLTLNGRDQALLGAAAMIGLPGLAAVAGLLVWLRRRA